MLLLGFALAQTSGNPFTTVTPRITHWLLQLSIIGMGVGMNVPSGFERSPYAFYIVAFLSFVISLVIGWSFLRKKIF